MNNTNPYLTQVWNPDKAERYCKYSDEYAAADGEEWERKRLAKEKEEKAEAEAEE